MFDKILFDSFIGEKYTDIITKFPTYTIYTHDNSAEIELEEGTLTCYFFEGKCFCWSFYTNNEHTPDYHSVPFVDLFPAGIYPTLPDNFGWFGLS